MYIFSSTSGIMPSALAQDLAHPGRLLIGHPFNPPHVLPLVEVVPGETTDPATVEAAVAFYTALGKTPVVLHKEIGGFVANRLQSAIFVRAAQLTDEGRCSDEQAALAKLFCTVRLREAVARGRELMGGNGMLLEYDLPRYWNDAEALYSYEGTREINTLLVGRGITGHGAFV